MTIRAGMSSSWAAWAMAWAWLPEEKARAPPLRCSGVLRQSVVGTAKLESAYALQVLAFEEQARAQLFVHGAAGQHRRAVGYALQALGSGHDIVISGQGGVCAHGRTGWGGTESMITAPRPLQPICCVAARLPVDGAQRAIEKIEKYERKRHAGLYW
jgi:hypothetical protein